MKSVAACIIFAVIAAGVVFTAEPFIGFCFEPVTVPSTATVRVVECVKEVNEANAEVVERFSEIFSRNYEDEKTVEILEKGYVQEIGQVQENDMFAQRMGDLRLMKAPEQTLVFSRNGLLFAFNFHSSYSLTNVLVPVQNKAKYSVELCSDDWKYGGFGQVAHQDYFTKTFNGQEFVELYLPARTCMVLKEHPIAQEQPKVE